MFDFPFFNAPGQRFWRKPAKTTECTALIRAQANIATAVCGIMGM